MGIKTHSVEATTITEAGTTGFDKFDGVVPLTDGVATPVCTLPLAQGAGAGGKIIVTVYATDGSDQQVFTGGWLWAAINQAGTITVDFEPFDTALTQELSAGSLSVVLTIAEGNADELDFNVSANTSLTTTTLNATVEATSSLSGLTAA